MQIHYTKGSENLVPDGLSRRPDYFSHLLDSTDRCAHLVSGAISLDLLARIAASQGTDTRLGERWKQANSKCGNWRVLETPQGRILCFKGRILVPANLVNDVLREYHDFRGHFGSNRVCSMVAKQFWWSTLAADVAQYCAKCDVCAR